MAELGTAFLNPIAESNKIDADAALAPVNLAHQQALARYANAEASGMEVRTQAEARAAALMAQRLGDGSSSTGTGSISDQLLGMASIYGSAGSPAQATKLLEAASTAQAHENVARNAQANMGLRQVQGQLQLASRAHDLLSGVTDDASWQDFNDKVGQAIGKPSPWGNMPYNPRLVSTLTDMALTAKDKATLAFKDIDAQRRQEDVDSKVATRDVGIQIKSQQLDLARQREARLAKVGGKDVGAPSSGDVSAAERILSVQPGLVAPEDLKQAAYDTAAQARALRKANPGMTMDDALRQAMVAKRASGDFAMKVPFTGGTTRPSYSVAMPLPASGKVKDLLPGQVYRNAAGARKKWNGKGWETAAGGAAPAKGRTTPDPEPDDDGENEE